MADLRLGGAETAQAAAPEELAAILDNIDHYDPLFIGNRVAMFRELHAQGQPIRHSTHHGGFWFVSGYPEALTVQRRPEDFSNKQKTVPRRPQPALIPAGLDPPQHRPVKMALQSLFLPAAAAALKTDLVRSARRLFDACIELGRFDVVQDLMLPLMAEFTMVHMLGLAYENAIRYAAVIHKMTRPVPDPAHAEQVKREISELTEEFREILAGRHYAPESMLAGIAALDIEGRRFSIEEMIKIAFNLAIGGFGTTATFTGTAFVFLGRNPQLRRQIVDDPRIIPSAVDEMLRLFAPVQSFARHVEHDTELNGVAIKAGEQLLMGYGAANFDPRTFADPELVDFRRVPNRHMAFGIGPHRCLGEPIARLVIAEVLAQMAQRIPNYEVVEEALVPQGFTSSMFGYANVPIRVTQAPV